MLQKMLFVVLATPVLGIANAQPLPDYSSDTIRVTAQWSQSEETPKHRPYAVRSARANTIISASPIAQMAVVPTALFDRETRSVTPPVVQVNPTVPTTPTESDEAEASFAGQLPGVNNLLSYARKHLSSRYRSGGTTPSGFDCSGFVRYCFTKFGISLPHSSAAQASVGAKVDREFAQPGDLIFFNGHAAGGSRVGHVGIITDVVNNQVTFIHSACGGGVKFDLLSADYYRKRFVTIRRVANLIAQK